MLSDKLGNSISSKSYQDPRNIYPGIIGLCQNVISQNIGICYISMSLFQGLNLISLSLLVPNTI